MPNLIPDWLPWMRPAGRLLWAVGLFVIGLLIVGYLMSRPKKDRPATWSECMLGAVGVFAMMTLGYAVIPHEWITFSDKYLQWNTTKFLFQGGHEIVLGIQWPFSLDYKSLSDVIVVGIYSMVFGLNLVLFAKWQQRHRADETAAAKQPRTSRFGRPLRRRQPAMATASDGGGEA